MRIRAFRPEDTEQVVALWRECELIRPWNDPHLDIERKRAVQPELFLVAEADVAGLDVAGADVAGADSAGVDVADSDVVGADVVGADVAGADSADRAVVATAMAGYDGHRGWVNYLAVAPARRGAGIARTLMAEVERMLVERGCPKLNLQVRGDNAQALAFYRALGYLEDHSVSLGKRLISDGVDKPADA